jgi:predicted unusual protein kinase regulating ubiquinone biosynthesis (AarF/ABC1/UbiB family)
MKEYSRIPTSKVERATRFAKTGVKVGSNFVKHYVKKTWSGDSSRTELHADNAEDIYNGLSELKGSALKVLQMMSLDKNILPTPYSDKFSLSQFSAPPLSYPLIVKIFQKYFKKKPDEVFDTFTINAVNAASIGQVHKATINGIELAVKVQYPGIAESVESDLRLVKPFATRIFNIRDVDIDYFFSEVKTRLLEETDYSLELQRSQFIIDNCRHIPNIVFPDYFPEYSCEKIITMKWLPGKHTGEFLKKVIPQDIRNKIGQTLWDFYDFQIHHLRQVHADPHPGNFLIQDDGTVGVIDFGCVKVIPEDFYHQYFNLIKPSTLQDPIALNKAFKEMRFIYDFDSLAEQELFSALFKESIVLLGRPFQEDIFDFGNSSYFEEIYQFGEKLSSCPELKASKTGRGPKDGLYINRTYFGLYNILNQLGSKIYITNSNVNVQS